MAETKKSTAKRIIDVQHPDKTPASDTSKPVIVTNRPILQDPMVSGTPEEDGPAKPLAGSGPTIQPLSAPELPNTKEPKEDEDPKKEEPKPAESPKKAKLKEDASTKTIAELSAESKLSSPDESSKEESSPTQAEDNGDPEGTPAEQTDQQGIKDEAVEAEKEAKQDAELQKLIDSKQYFLPINTVEKRRSKHVVTFGILLSVILLVAWVDIALDAGLIDLGGVKPLTHFFSS